MQHQPKKTAENNVDEINLENKKRDPIIATNQCSLNNVRYELEKNVLFDRFYSFKKWTFNYLIGVLSTDLPFLLWVLAPIKRSVHLVKMSMNCWQFWVVRD
jgi:hypothetical protein